MSIMLIVQILGFMNFEHFEYFVIAKCAKCGKFRFPIMNTIMAFMNFVTVVLIFTQICHQSIVVTVYGCVCLLFICSCISVWRQPISAVRQPHMLFWCQACAKSAMGLQAAISPFVNLRSAHLFLRYPYRSGTISALLSITSDNDVICKNTSLIFNISTPSLFSVYFCFKKIFSVIRHFDECCYLS